MCIRDRQRWSFSFVNQAELSFLRRDMSIDEIEKVYMQKICDNDLQKSQLQEQKLCIDDKIEKLKSQKKEIDIKMEHLKEGYQNFEKYNVAVPEDSVLNEFDLCKLNDVLDRVRYAEFWLAVHYYCLLYTSILSSLMEADEKPFNSFMIFFREVK